MTSSTSRSSQLKNYDQDQWTLHECITHALERYLNQTKPYMLRNLYNIILEKVEIPLLEILKKHTQDNHVKMAAILGISRGTRRKKMKTHGLFD